MTNFTIFVILAVVFGIVAFVANLVYHLFKDDIFGD